MGVGAALVLVTAVSAGTAPGGDPAALLRLPVRRAAEPARPVGTVLDGARAIVTLWASYCPPCRAEVPAMQRAARRWRPHGVRVLGIATDLDDATEVARVSAAWGIDYETYWVAPDDRPLLEALAPEGLPVTFFVAPDGVTRWDRFFTEGDVETVVPRRLGLPASARPGGG